MGEKHKATIKVGEKVSLLVSILFQLKKDNQLDENLKHLQDKYDNLFTDTEIEFRYNGFNDGKEKFLREFTEIQKELEEKLDNKYKVVNKILV